MKSVTLIGVFGLALVTLLLCQLATASPISKDDENSLLSHVLTSLQERAGENNGESRATRSLRWFNSPSKHQVNYYQGQPGYVYGFSRRQSEVNPNLGRGKHGNRKKGIYFRG